MSDLSIPLEDVLFQLFMLVLLARLAAGVFTRAKMPGLIGEILVGVLVMNLVIGDWSMADWLHLHDDMDVLTVLSELGVVFLLFTVGLETKFSDLKKVGNTAVTVAVLGVLFPFFMGYLVLYAWPSGAHTQIECLFMGAAMVATSVGITARVIKDMKLTHTIESKVIVGAAVIDDILGMIILAIVAGMAASGGGSIDVMEIVWVAVVALLFVGASFLIAAKVLPGLKARMRKDEEGKCIAPRMESMTGLSLALILLFFLAFVAQAIGLAAIIGAFLAGMMFAEFEDVFPVTHSFESLNEFLVSFFFIMVGMQVDLGSFGTEVIILGLVITIVAVLTKLIGCGFGARKLGGQTSKIIGIGMVPRGEVGIIVAQIGLAQGVVSGSVYNVVVLMSLLTTLIAPFWLASAFRKKTGGVEYEADLDVSV